MTVRVAAQQQFADGLKGARRAGPLCGLGSLRRRSSTSNRTFAGPLRRASLGVR